MIMGILIIVKAPMRISEIFHRTSELRVAPTRITREKIMLLTALKIFEGSLPRIAIIHIQNTESKSPRQGEVDTPTILPVPTRDAVDTISAEMKIHCLS